MKRENVIGRANVEDTPALEEYYRALEGDTAFRNSVRMRLEALGG